MPVTWDIDRAAIAGSSITIAVSFAVGSTAVTPDSITWSLYKESDNSVVNNREDVAIGTPASTVNITLSGADLPNTSDDRLDLILKVEAVYDSDYGNDLPLKNELTFPVLPLQND
jgi:hypothetical protein